MRACLQVVGKGLRWEAAEHKLFLQQLSLHGTDWEAIQVSFLLCAASSWLQSHCLVGHGASVNSAVACTCKTPTNLQDQSIVQIAHALWCPQLCKLPVQAVLPHRTICALKHQSRNVDLMLLKHAQHGEASVAKKERPAAAGHGVEGRPAHTLAGPVSRCTFKVFLSVARSLGM